MKEGQNAILFNSLQNATQVSTSVLIRCQLENWCCYENFTIVQMIKNNNIRPNVYQ